MENQPLHIQTVLVEALFRIAVRFVGTGSDRLEPVVSTCTFTVEDIVEEILRGSF